MMSAMTGRWPEPWAVESSSFGVVHAVALASVALRKVRSVSPLASIAMPCITIIEKLGPVTVPGIELVDQPWTVTFCDRLALAPSLSVSVSLTGYSPLAVKHMKTLIGYSGHLEFEPALGAEVDLVMGYATQSNDATEGLFAFLERRPPNFTGT